MNTSMRKGIYAIIVILILIFFLQIIGVTKDNLLEIDAAASFELFNVLVTMLATVLVVLQLHESRKVTCCEMMSQMNLAFVENKRMMKLYKELEKSYRDETFQFIIYDEEVNDDNSNHIYQPDLVAYLTFYESLYSYLQAGVISIKELDNYFGDRFFKLVHNTYIQNNELYLVPSSYANIFELYRIWYGYRIKNKTALVAGNAHPIPMMYVKRSLYMEETLFLDNTPIKYQFHGKMNDIELCYKRLFASNVKEVLSLQNVVLTELKEEGKQEYLVRSSEEEILESMLIDYCYGLYDDDKLIAFCITVLNRNSNRNLAKIIKKRKHYKDYVSVDTVQVHPAYRGYRIQKFFLEKSQEISYKCEAKNMLATVSLNNTFSEQNFLEFGFEKSANPVIIYEGEYKGAERNVFIKQL